MSAFWENRNLADFSPDEWELLCDGCGRCCLHKLEDETTSEVYYTNVACQLLDETSCRCQDYQHRKEIVPDCLVLEPSNSLAFDWLPATCAYRLVHEGKQLYWWHHLISGDPDTVHTAGISVQDQITSEQDVSPDELENHIIHWIDF